MRGWVYLITNKAMPDLVKIGFSTKDPVLRAEELNHTGAPHPYEVVYDLLVINPYQIEQQTHKFLAEKREGKEWFRCSIAEAVAAIRKTAGDSIILDTDIEFIEENLATNQNSSESIKLGKRKDHIGSNVAVTCRTCGSIKRLMISWIPQKVDCASCGRYIGTF